MKKTEAIIKFLRSSTSPIAAMYTPNMEVQVNVAKDKGIRIKGEYKGRNWRGWKDPETGEQWKSYRIPWNADTEPEYTDSEIRFDLSKHVEGLGMTGWDWKNRQSLWVGYDFDSITTHDKGLSNEELSDLERKTMSIPWVTLLRSTGGKGIHIYLFFDKPFPTKTHTEHAAVARSLLSTLTVETGFNFAAGVDCVGSVLWCYHRKQEGTQGLSYIKKGEKFPISKIPVNWKEHISVCSRSKKKTHSGDRAIESLSSSLKSFFLDDEHLRILKWVSSNAKKDWWWDSDYNMLICHTWDLRDCHVELSLKGIFETNSSGSSEQNCFAFPSRLGSFVVRRHGSRTAEARTWVLEESGWTKCNLNAEPTIHDACITNGALENDRGEYIFADCVALRDAMLLIGLSFTYPMQFKDRQVALKIKGSKLIAKIDVLSEDDKKITGFLKDKKKWIKVLVYRQEAEDIPSQDSLVRHVIAQKAEAGWFINIGGDWVQENKSNVISVLQADGVGIKTAEVNQIIGKTILDPWTLVNQPFNEEYLSGRRWNKEAPQLSVKPVQGKVDAWWDLLEHLGRGLDEAVLDNVWCLHNGITNGAEYLFAWISFMFMKPNQPLPYLFFFGEQKTGKSTLHEALSLMFKYKVGYTRADIALKNTSGFNLELAHSVLCVIEETDLSKSPLAANRTKDWVTGVTISIQPKGKNTYEVENTTHWMQCANDAKYCLVLRGDTRIVVIEVDQLEKEIPKEVFMQSLKNELKAFLYEIIHYELPEPEGRLQLPVLLTEAKTNIVIDNYTELEEFYAEKTFVKIGHYTSLPELHSMFQLWLAQNYPAKQSEWTSRKVLMKFPKKPPVVKGIMGSSKCFGNLSMYPEDKDKSFKYIVTSNGRLKKITL